MGDTIYTSVTEDRGDIVNILNQKNQTIEQFADSVAAKIGHKVVSFLGKGSQGYAFDLGGNIILKITSDKSEAIEALRLVGQKNKHIGDFYSVYDFKSYPGVYAIIREKLFLDVDKTEAMFERFDRFLAGLGLKPYNVRDLIMHSDSKYTQVFDDGIKNLNRQDPNNYAIMDIIAMIDEVRAKQIRSFDSSVKYNFGFKPNGDIAYYDIGYSSRSEKPNFQRIALEELNEDKKKIKYLSERIKTYMGNSVAVGVKKECQLGGLGNGKSKACNQGDINALDLHVLKENIRNIVGNQVDQVLNEAKTVEINNLPFTNDIHAAGGKIYAVGGSVRDFYIGRQSKDLDVLVTGVPAEQLEAILRKHGRVDKVGKSFGVMKFNSPQTGEIDVAIPRTEKKNDQGGYRGFDVNADHNLPIEKDLERRDFTINAMAKDVHGNLIDVHNGMVDVKNKQIRMVNPQAFSDDPLRMIRAVQFAARFGFTIEEHTLEAIRKNAYRIREIPFERILEEFNKIIGKGNPYIGAQYLQETGLYQAMFNTHQALELLVFEGVKTMGEFIYSLLSRIKENPAQYFKDTMEGDNDTTNEIKAYELANEFNSHPSKKIIFDMYRLSPQSVNTKTFGDKLVNTVNYMKERNIPFSMKGLAINGNDLMQLGVKEGGEVGEILRDLITKIYANQLLNNREQLMAYVQQLLGQNKEQKE